MSHSKPFTFYLQAIEDVHLPQRPWLKLGLKIMDKVFTVIFVFEMFVKLTAFGFKKYYTDAWCWLDFIIVIVSIRAAMHEQIFQIVKFVTFKLIW